MFKKTALGIMLAFATSAAFATTPGTDNAGDPIYGGLNAGSFDGKDGGTAATFGAWSVIATPPQTSTAGSFIGDSTTLNAGNTGGNINSSGVAFALFAHTGANADATRSFDSPLLSGQTFTIQLAVNFRNGNKGFDLRDASSTSIFNLNIGGDAYNVNNVTTGGGVLFNSDYNSNTVFSIALTQTTLAGGTWTVTRSGGLTGTASGTYTGLASSIHLYNSQTTGGGSPEDNLFFNNLAVVPEPTTLSLLAGPGILGAWFFARRRRS